MQSETGLSPSVKYFTDRPQVVLLLWIIFIISVLLSLLLSCYRYACVLLFIDALFIDALWSPAWKGLTSWLSFVMSKCKVVILP